jgi:hypothetical protein
VEIFISVPRHEAEGLAAELWAEREDGRPWSEAWAQERDAYAAFAALTLIALRNSDEYAGTC